MPKRDRTIERLDELARLKSVTDRGALVAALGPAIEERVNLVVAKAAGLAASKDLRELSERLVAAFDRFMSNPEKSDPGCAAKTAIVDALVKFQSDCRDLLLRGLRHHQYEPVWGGSQDTAARLRGLCAIGLVALGYKEVLYELAELIFDDDAEARLLAVRALGGTGTDAAALLLRAKLAAGKDSAEIFGECFASLLSLQPGRSIDYIAQFLASSDPSLVQAAALSIGGSRNERAFSLLQSAYGEIEDLDSTAAVLLGMAMTRQPAAVEFLIQKISDPAAGAEAVAALRIFKSDPAIAQRVEQAIGELQDPNLPRRWRSG